MRPLDRLLADLGFPPRPGWQRDAACREHPEVAFVPGKGQRAAPARAVCAGCLVRVDCLAYALADPDLVGVWGGTTGAERAALRRSTAA